MNERTLDLFIDEDRTHCRLHNNIGFGIHSLLRRTNSRKAINHLPYLTHIAASRITRGNLYIN